MRRRGIKWHGLGGGGKGWPDNIVIGRSKQELDSDNITAATANFRIVELSKDPDNSDTASANCNFLVRVNEGLYYDNAAGI